MALKFMSDKISYVTVLFLLLLVGCATSPRRTGPVPTTLVLGLDGIPYTTFKKMQDGGHFRNFFPVQPMVASFPSISDPNWSLLMRTGPENNFTKAYFDPTVKTSSGFGADQGSIITHLSKEPRYEQLMDFKVDGPWQHLSMFIWTDTTAHYWLESLQKEFFEFSGRDTYFALIVNTDILSHTEGEMELMKYLADIEDTIYKIQDRYKKRYGRDLNVVLVSDHGNYYTAPQDIPFDTELPKLGWNLAETISGPHDVGFYVPEMLGFGSFYCQPRMTRQLAHDLSEVDSVHVGMYMNGPDEVRVFGDKGRSESEITFDEKRGTVDYKVLNGKDPFDQISLFKSGPLKLKDYFYKTLDMTYPNALARIWDGFKRNSKIKPQVLVDAQLGHVFGNKMLRLMTNLRGFASTHGSLRREESLGIFTSTSRKPYPLSPEQFGDFVNVKEIGTNL